MANAREPKSLCGWKEIADHLGVNARTAQRWEAESGLPVQRLEGPRGRVTADAEELDRWRQSAVTKPSPWSNLRFLRVWAVGATTLILTSSALLGWRYWRATATGPPVNFRLDNHILRVLDSQSRLVWQHDFDILPSGGEYLPDKGYQRVRFADLNHDGRNELLFAYYYQSNESARSELLCFSDTGKLLWRFKPGGTLADAGQSYSPDYVLDQFALVHGQSPDPLIVTVSHHSIAYPSHVAVLSASGDVRGNYWHSGHLYHIATADLDGDGVEDVLLGGVNNGYQQATVVVLDPRRVSGASTQPPGDPHQFRDLNTGTEKVVVLFPRTLLNERFEPFSWVMALWMAQGQINLTVREKRGYESGYLTYTLDRNLNVLSVIPSEGLVKLYEEFRASGQITRDLFREELPRLHQVRVIRGDQKSLAATVPHR
jgi:hypothetical protein